MLLTLTSIANNKWLNAIKKFLYSPYYIGLVAAISACANLFGLELPVWYAYTFLAIVGALFADDALPFVPLVCCGYITVSYNNNPAGHYGSSLFDDKSSITQLIIIGVMLVATVIARLVFDLVKPKVVNRKRNLPRLLYGLIFLGLAYIFAGVMPAPAYEGLYWKSVLFGIVQIACLAVPYLYFHYTVDWDKVKRTYLAQVFVGLGFALVAEIIGMYVIAFDSLSAEETFRRGLLVTGWGIYNNVGFLMAFCIPFAFNLAVRCRHEWLYSIIGVLFEVALLFTQSRGSILCGTAIFLVCAVYTAWKLKGHDRWVTVGATLGFCLALGVLWIIFREEMSQIFATMKDAGFDDSNRFKIYRDGLAQFAESVQSIFFGNGFYACKNFRWGNLPEDAFLPPRYHNTIVQLLATGGIFALICYLFHRVQTLQVCLIHRTQERLFALAAILVLTSSSMLDCHFFNMGPGLVYSIMLVFAEDVISNEHNSEVTEALPQSADTNEEAQN
ncbi:MAG: O-antigen ligase family protein [Clostridiales bacterium]|nr:O-antigen ligase family protein [Clostridiales bacterium]